MESINTAIIYYSSTGANHQLASWAEETAEKAGANVRVRKVPETAPESAIEANPAWKEHYSESQNVEEASLEDLEWADAIIFSAPTRYGAVPSQMRSFIDSTGPLWQEGKLVNKVVSAMTSAMNDHGGQEQTIMNLYTSMFHWGAIIAAPGYSDESIFGAGGNPYGTSVSADLEGNIQADDLENVKKAVSHQTRRTMEIASRVAVEEAEAV
jgi:NAD(P)H dehydrogenase (quinone)